MSFDKMYSNDAFRINWEIIDRHEGFSRRFGMTSHNAEVKSDYNVGNNEVSIDQVLFEVELTLNAIIHELLHGASDDDYVRVSINNELLDYEIYTPFRKCDIFTTEMIMSEIVKVVQSKKEFLLHGLLDIDVIHVKPTGIGGGAGGSKWKKSVVDINSWKRNSKKVICVKKDSSNLCVARSLVVCKAYEDGIKGNKWRRIRDDFEQTQYKEALKLCKDSNVIIKDNRISNEDFDKFQSFLSPEYQIVIVMAPKNYYYVGNINANKQLYLFLSENHCDALLSIKAF